MRVEIGDDFAKYRRYRSIRREASPLYPMFDTASSFVDATNGFWICGFDHTGDLIHTQAARLLDLKDQSLEAHLYTHRHKYITPDSTPDPDETVFTGPRALASITGKIVYQGDFWLPSRGLGGPRSQGATPVLSRILFELAKASWDPDFIFALVPKRLAAKGAHLRYGYTHCEPGVWMGPDRQVTDEDYLIWMSAEDMTSALRTAPNSLQQGATVSPIATAMAAIDAKG